MALYLKYSQIGIIYYNYKVMYFRGLDHFTSQPFNYKWNNTLTWEIVNWDKNDMSYDKKAANAHSITNNTDCYLLEGVEDKEGPMTFSHKG